MSLINRIKTKYFPTLSQQLGYSSTDVIVIVNIDDVGMQADETAATFKALKFGLVKTGSIMVPCQNFDQVMKLWKENPQIDLGIHLTLTCEWGEKYPWTPVLSRSDVPSLYNHEGIMWPDVPTLLHHAAKEHIVSELEAQINKVFAAGLKPTHIDDHMDLHNNTNLFPIIMDLSCKYHLPMRVWKRRRYKYPIFKYNLISLRRRGMIFPDSQKGFYYMGGENHSLNFRKAKYHDYLRSLGPGVHNIKIHTAHHTESLENIMGKHYAAIRQIDYEVWTCEETKKLAEEIGIIFIGYRPLQQLQEILMSH